jgi:hypothetical protein
MLIKLQAADAKAHCCTAKTPAIIFFGLETTKTAHSFVRRRRIRAAHHLLAHDGNRAASRDRRTAQARKEKI